MNLYRFSRCFLLFAGVLSFIALPAQTIIDPGAEVFGTWKKKESPYLIQGEATVPLGRVLEIEAGVEVAFKVGLEKDYTKPEFEKGLLRVEGQLIAKGKERDWVVFTRQGNEGNWGLLIFANGKVKSELTYCRIAYAGQIDKPAEGVAGAFGAISNIGGNMIIDYCLMDNNEIHGFYGFEGQTVMNGAVITGNSSTGICFQGERQILKMSNTIIWDNEKANHFDKVKGDFQISYSLIQGSSDLLPTQFTLLKGNLFSREPRFMAPVDVDYHLDDKSPSKKSGKGGVDMGLYPKGGKALATKTKKAKPDRNSGQKTTSSSMRPDDSGDDVEPAQNYALLIGVQRYQDRDIKPMKGAVKDMRKLRKTLLNFYHYDDPNVTVLENPRKEDMVNALNALYEQMNPQDQLLIYYSGQSYWDNVENEGYWLGADADPKNRKTWLENERIRNFLDYHDNLHTFLVSETQFAGVGAARGESSASFEQARTLKSRQAYTGTETYIDQPRKSVFNSDFLKVLKDDRAKAGDRGILYVYRKGMKGNSPYTGQIIMGESDEGGVFFFKPK